MKKFFLLITLSFFLSSFCLCETIYITSDSLAKPSSMKLWSETLSKLQTEVSKYGIEIVESKSLKYPCIEVNASSNLEINIRFDKTNMNLNKHISFPITKYSSDENGVTINQNINSDVIVNFIISLLENHYDKSNSKNEPVLIDSFYPSTFYGYEIESSLTSPLYLTGFNDYSFAIKDGKTLRTFDSSVTLKQNLFSNLSVSDKTLTSNWKFNSSDGENLFAINEYNTNLYVFSKNGSLLKKDIKEFPSLNEYSDFFVSNNGTLFFSQTTNSIYKHSRSDSLFSSENQNYNDIEEQRNSYQLWYTDKTDGLKSFPIFKEIDENKLSYCIGNNDEIWIHMDRSYRPDNTYDYVFVYNKNGVLKNFFTEHRDFINTMTENLPLEKNNPITRNAYIAFIFPDNSYLVKYDFRRNNLIINSVYTCFNSNGSEKWNLQLNNDLKNLEIADYRNNILYFIDQKTKKVYRFSDNIDALPELLKKISEHSVALKKNKRDYDQYINLAETYYAAGGFWLAYENYKNYLEYCPADSKIKEKCFLTETTFQKKIATEYGKSAITTLEEYGEESAREDYSKSMKILEHLKKQIPWDEEVQNLYSDLRTAFHPELTVKNQKTSDIKIKSINLFPIFPALFNVYSHYASGVITVKNDSDYIVKNLAVKSFVRKYMDFPYKNDFINELKPGEEVSIDIITPFNETILNLDEDINVQAQITLEWEENNSNETLSISRPITIYKKSAMSWNDTAMLSCFILPNDKTVSSFVFSILDSTAKKNKSILSQTFSNAISISNSLGSLPINYVPDPVSPTTDLIGNEYAIDTVRFPQKTLLLKGGDCDDMTVLFCSALESAGIKTALITTPGHIFAAFNSELRTNEIFENLGDYKIIDVEGFAWIPIEVTCLNLGFCDAWKKASEEISQGIEEFVIVSEARVQYPPISIEGSESKINFNKQKIEDANERAIAEIKSVMEGLLKTYENSSDDELLNSAAKIYHLMGDDENAISTLLKAVNINRSNPNIYHNLVKLCEKNNCLEKLEQLIVKPSSIKPDRTAKDIHKNRSWQASQDFVWAE